MLKLPVSKLSGWMGAFNFEMKIYFSFSQIGRSSFFSGGQKLIMTWSCLAFQWILEWVSVDLKESYIFNISSVSRSSRTIQDFFSTLFLPSDKLFISFALLWEKSNIQWRSLDVTVTTRVDLQYVTTFQFTKSLLENSAKKIHVLSLWGFFLQHLVDADEVSNFFRFLSSPFSTSPLSRHDTISSLQHTKYFDCDEIWKLERIVPKESTLCQHTTSPHSLLYSQRVFECLIMKISLPAQTPHGPKPLPSFPRL